MASALSEGRNMKGEAVRGNVYIRLRAFPQVQGCLGYRLQGVGSLLPEMTPGFVVRKKTFEGPASLDHNISAQKMTCTYLL